MNARQIEQAAADWFVQRTGGGWSDGDQARLDAWIDESLAHRIAYVRVESVWNEVERLQVVRAGVAPGVLPPRGTSVKWVPPIADSSNVSAVHTQPKLPAIGKRWKNQHTIMAIAASFVLVTITAFILNMSGLLGGQRYVTAVGKIDTVKLADGSAVTLNTDSDIRVDIKTQERNVVLDKGEAFFQIAKDPARPFTVNVGDKRIVVVGTQFSVRRVGDDIRVAVTEGTVRLEYLAGAYSAAKLMRAGDMAHTDGQKIVIEQHSLRQAEEGLSWRRGYLVFQNTALKDAVAEFNRYNARKIIIADSSVENFQIGGYFHATSTDVFLWMLQNGFPVTVEENSREVVLKAR